MGLPYKTIKTSLSVLLIVWIIGLIWFAETINQPPEDLVAHTDAIVVLTGGSNRLEAGLDLLKNKTAKKLFITGVDKQVSLEDLKVEYNLEQANPSQVELGHEALNTKGNAKETYQWLRQNNFKSIRLVTANYHMPRSLLEFRYYMPDIVIIPHPISPDCVHQDDWWSWPGTLSLIVREYSKFLFVYIKETLFAP